MSGTTGDQMAIFSMLEAEHAKMHNMPDEEFSDAYMAFRSRVEATIRNQLGVSDTDDSWWNTFKGWAASGLSWLTNFMSGEMVTPLARDANTFSLDPAPFKDMIHVIMAHSKPNFANTFEKEHSIKDLNKLKNFAKTVIEAVADFGPSQAVVQRQFYKSIVAVIDSINVSDVKTRVQRSEEQYTVEVKKVGTVYIGLFKTTFDGEISEGCCSDDQYVTMNVDVRVWKFATVGELKKEYERVKK